MILLVTSQQHEHANRVEEECQQQKLEYARFHLRDFPTQTSLTVTPHDQEQYSSLTIHSQTPIPSSQINSIWYYAPSPPMVDPSVSQVYAQMTLREIEHAFADYCASLWDCYWMNSPSKTMVGFNKPYHLHVASLMGLPIPDTIFTNSPNEASQFLDVHGGTAVYKPIIRTTHHANDSSYTGYATLIKAEQLKANKAGIAVAPCLFQEAIEKQKEITVFVIGNEVFAAEIIVDDDPDSVDWRKHVKTYQVAHIPDSLANRCIQMTKYLGLAMCNYDIAYTVDDQYVFLDANPTEQWLHIEEATQLPITSTIVEVLHKSTI